MGGRGDMRLEQKQLIMKNPNLQFWQDLLFPMKKFHSNWTEQVAVKQRMWIKSHGGERNLLTSSSVDLTDSLLARITVWLETLGSASVSPELEPVVSSSSPSPSPLRPSTSSSVRSSGAGAGTGAAAGVGSAAAAKTRLLARWGKKSFQAWQRLSLILFGL